MIQVFSMFIHHFTKNENLTGDKKERRRKSGDNLFHNFTSCASAADDSFF
jgi:hypothetical protein